MVKKTVALGRPEVSHLIHKVRHLTGLSLEQFAATLGVALSMINRWENGSMQPSLLPLKQIKMMFIHFSRSPVVELVEQSQTLLAEYFSEAELSV
ncbi:helix-turn-helix transcriptional regulator [Anabaena sphaerica FACHB-251]|uniref:Helix-turn-helix transcriptional regulator n=1 Tax=Anabaena sphaerica FACHB-251 TaxID=2692883 RepID=A0A926WFD8_9NOST|nr:helix-turn-helix transcriptional regulator [Anabaena sphaerica]MBD2293427.1 helix-turn-helix transcriptional regulator [Anabaena sphaerica FACHB-251]